MEIETGRLSDNGFHTDILFLPDIIGRGMTGSDGFPTVSKIHSEAIRKGVTRIVRFDKGYITMILPEYYEVLRLP